MENTNMRVVVLLLSLVGYVLAVGPSYDDVCKIGRPDPDVLNCGRGGQDCKEGYYCEIASDDRYAKCCLKEKENCYPLKRKRICATSTTTAEPECPSGQEYNECGTDCPPTCDDPTPVCTLQCVSGCFCPNGKVLRNPALSDECILPSQCPPQCPDDEVYNECGSACPPTCEDPPSFCAAVC